MTAGRTTVSAVAAVLAAALLVVVLVTWAASIGPGGVLEGPGVQAERSSPAEQPPESKAPPPSPAPPRTDNLPRAANDGGPAEAWIRAIAFVVLVATVCLALFLLFLLARRLRESYDARRRRDERPEEVAFEVIQTPAVVAREILHDAEAQRLVLAAGPPGNAIVECWHRFETQAAAAGLSRQPWETSSEFTLRILELVAADDRAVFRLAGLYREARFSEHTMTEAHRAAALEALDVIHHGLRAPVSRGPA
jgi:hypothetical protein